MVIGTDGYETVVSEGEVDPGFGNAPILLGWPEDGVALSQVPYNSSEYKGPAQLVVPTDSHGGRYANQICRIKVAKGALWQPMRHFFQLDSKCLTPPHFL
jgi:hypothetical protein